MLGKDTVILSLEEAADLLRAIMRDREVWIGVHKAMSALAVRAWEKLEEADAELRARIRS